MIRIAVKCPTCKCDMLCEWGKVVELDIRENSPIAVIGTNGIEINDKCEVCNGELNLGLYSTIYPLDDKKAIESLQNTIKVNEAKINKARANALRGKFPRTFAHERKIARVVKQTEYLKERLQELEKDYLLSQGLKDKGFLRATKKQKNNLC